jgi:hypothetical protein
VDNNKIIGNKHNKYLSRLLKPFTGKDLETFAENRYSTAFPHIATVSQHFIVS